MDFSTENRLGRVVKVSYCLLEITTGKIMSIFSSEKEAIEARDKTNREVCYPLYELRKAYIVAYLDGEPYNGC